MSSNDWRFCIDVGGTFTDVVARTPTGKIITRKLLSSGILRGSGVVESGGKSLRDAARVGEVDGLWCGYRLTIFEGDAASAASGRVVTRFSGGEGRLVFDRPLDCRVGATVSYALASDEEAPVVAVRCLMGLALGDEVGPIAVRLGTTRATNALLERKGANVAFVTTKGFADVLAIGYQDRPDLFKLNVRKRDELASTVVEIDERLSANGTVLRTPDLNVVRDQLVDVRQSGVEALAICFLHAHINPEHERQVAAVAHRLSFSHVSASSNLSRLERIVPRGDTTVLDAYLSGVIRSYIATLRRSMPQARIQLMTSSAGLVDAGAVSGKDTVLSGPAGGVLGCARVVRQAGFDRAIAFDMGGTSTDVSRIEPPPAPLEYQHETVKAGVRIMAPMLAVETVAAGGGSVCAFDGQKLTVGPHSAGADPGPCCYGRGGPLAVTDMNVALGRITSDHFPFRLDRARVDERLAELCEAVNASTGSSFSTIELADGFVKIANAKMSAAIRTISIAKGYDVRDYVLSTFGGAGGQHACAIARRLGITRVLLSPYAGVLSAVGIASADVKRIGQRSVSVRWSASAMETVGPVIEAITDELRETLLAEGVSPGALSPPTVTFDLCYEGQSTLIPVSRDALDDMRHEFESRHRRLYGYHHAERPVEIRVVRVELAARSEPFDLDATQTESATSPAPDTTKMVVDGVWQDVPLYFREQLAKGTSLRGPAMVIEKTSTIVIEDGWEGSLNAYGDLILTDVTTGLGCEEVSSEAEPIQLELFNNQFAAIAEQMGTTLRRTALSTNVKERLDFSCAVFTPTGDLVVNAPHIPVHLGGMSDCVKSLMADVGTLHPGDVYVTNDPYRGGSHLNDVTVITPVHDSAGERVIFFVASRAHHAEIGGRRPGSMPPDSTCLADEGVLIRAVRWLNRGVLEDDALRAVLTDAPHPSRNPEENLADIAAQVAANQTGVADLTALVERYGLGIVHDYMRHIQDAAARKTRVVLRKMADGVYSFTDRLDDGSAIRLRVTIRDDSAVFDFSGSDPVLPGNLNANRSIVTSAVLYCLRCLIDEDIPLNSGVLEPVTIVLPECFLNPAFDTDPKRCPAVAGGNVETSQRVVDTVLGALKSVAASQGTMNNVLIGNDKFGYYETICGGAGAGPGFDGADAVHTHMTNTRLTDPEVLESRYPIRVIRFAIRHGSGGSGAFRGGCGVVRELEFLETLDLSLISQRRHVAPYGVAGGGAGMMGVNRIYHAKSGVTDELPPIASVRVFAGDRLTIETPGGGGWGTEAPSPEHAV